MSLKFGLVASTMAALGGVMVNAAALPLQARSGPEPVVLKPWKPTPHVEARAAPETIVLTPYKPKKPTSGIKAANIKTLATGTSGAKSAQVADKSVMLQESETLYWFSEGYYASATLTSLDKKDKIASADAWEDMITGLECPNDKDLTVKFNNDVSMDDIKAQLGWIGESKENNLVFVANEQCGGEDGRQPYIITDFEVGTDAKVTLKGAVAEWEDLMVESNIHVSSTPFGVFEDEMREGLTKRADGYLDLATDMSGFKLVDTQVKDVNLALTCAECKLTGGINWDLSFNKNPFSSKFGPEGTLTTANGFGGRFALGVRASGALVDGMELANLELLALPLSPISLGKIAKLTPQITVNALASISAIQAEVEAKFGVGMVIPDGTAMRIRGDSDEFKPDFEMIGPEIKGKVSVSAVMTPLVTLDITAEVLSKGVTVGFGVEAPRMDAKLAVEANSEGVCGNPNGILSLSGSVGVGAAINFFYGLGSPKDQPNKTNLYTFRHELWGECLVLEEKQPEPEPEPVPEPEPTPVEPEVPVETPIETPIETPTEPEGPIETPIENPIDPIETPIETPTEPEGPIETPIQTPTEPEGPIETPILTPTEPEGPIETPIENPVETPIVYDPVETPTEPEGPIETPIQTPTEPEGPIETPVTPVDPELPVETPTEPATPVETPIVEEPQPVDPEEPEEPEVPIPVCTKSAARRARLARRNEMRA